MLNFIRKILTLSGLLPTLRYSMEGVLLHIRSLNFYPELIIDIGVAKGTTPLLKVFPKSKYLWIEPLLEFESNLKELAKKYKGDYILAAAGSSVGTLPINVHRAHLEGSSLYKESDGAIFDGQERNIPVVTLDSIKERYQMFENILLKIDVQGAEIDVLKGALQVLPACEVVILEVLFFEVLKGIPQFFEVVAFMKSNGFEVYDIVNGYYRPIDGALFQEDILFVKENGRFRITHRYATDEQRKIYKIKR
jgi:FkbM family methyltransferase